MTPVHTLTTERLILRPLTEGDAADVLTFRGDPIVQRFDDPPIQSLDESREFIAELERDAAERRLDAWGVVWRESGRVFGLVTLQYGPGDAYHRRAEIGYGIARAHWGKGYGSEAVSAVVRHAFHTLRLHRIYARTIAENTESVRMLERLGFVREGTQREHSWEEEFGRFADSALYGLLRSDWGYTP